jgi:hypothetical protein
MTHSAFLRTVLALWGDHWQQPCLELFASHGFHYTRKTLRNYRDGKRRVPEYIEIILLDEKRAWKSAS